MIKVGFIGTGNMGSALATTASKGKNVELLLANKQVDQAVSLANQLGGRAVDNTIVAAESDYIFLGVKPQNLDGLMEEIRDVLHDRNDEYVLVSMIAGKTMQQIEALVEKSCPIIRLQPNIANMVQEGVIMYAYNHQVSHTKLETMLEFMKTGGHFYLMEEKLMAAGAGVSSCGPAFAAMFIDALAEGGVACGLSRQEAVALASQMVKGTAHFIMEKNIHPDALRDMVCSPAGTTIQGVRTLERLGFRSSVIEAVISTYENDKML